MHREASFLPRGLIVTLIQRSAAQGVVGTVAIARLTHFFAASGDEKGRANHRSRNRRFDQNFFAHKPQRTQRPSRLPSRPLRLKVFRSPQNFRPKPFPQPRVTTDLAIHNPTSPSLTSTRK